LIRPCRLHCERRLAAEPKAGAPRHAQAGRAERQTDQTGEGPDPGAAGGLSGFSQQYITGLEQGRRDPSLPGIGQYRATLQNITRTSNPFLFQVVEQMADAYSGGIPHGWSAERLRPRCQGFVDAFLTERNAFVLANQEFLLAALQGDSALEAVAA